MKLLGQKILHEEFLIRKSRNENYSLRAFARDLALPRTAVAEVIAGRRRLSAKNIIKLRQRLSLSDEQFQRLNLETRLSWKDLA